ncbi:MAG TPA: hypothetical protein VGJ50_29170 [Streptosporangiaceae bacterium]|jgi:hypothetical protein
MAGEVTYFAIVGAGRSAQAPSGLARRRYAAVGPVDETLRRDLTWKPDSAIIQWEYGEVGADLIEISEADADRLVAMFRLAWDQPD